jgi:PIN domain nuclease of toxin-antitoxin system
VIGPSVLDASALVAFVYDEPGADRLEPAIRAGAFTSTINWAETLSRMVERGETVDAALARLRLQIAALGKIDVVPFTESHAREAARLRQPTRHLGLSLADRACLALGRLHRLPVLTTDRAWRSLRISVKIEVIR